MYDNPVEEIFSVILRVVCKNSRVHYEDINTGEKGYIAMQLGERMYLCRFMFSCRWDKQCYLTPPVPQVYNMMGPRDRDRLWFMYSMVCTCMLMFLCWKMGTMTSGRPYRVYVQQTEVGGMFDPFVIGEAPVKSHRNQTSTTIFPPTMIKRKNINSEIIKYFTLQQNQTKDVLINLHRYNFTINSYVCSSEKVFLIIVIHSAPENKEKRYAIRKTFGSVRKYRGLKIRLVFMMGATRRTHSQDFIKMESKIHGDIVQGDFQDIYKSLNKKHVMAMHWYINHCSADYILKLDDDTFVNPFRTIDFLLTERPQGKFIHCQLVAKHMLYPLRDKQSEYYTSPTQYPFLRFPPFCLGYAYLTTPKAWMALYGASEDSRSMDMDDVWVSAILALKAGVRRFDLGMNKNILPCRKDKCTMSLERVNETILIQHGCGRFGFKKWKELQTLNEPFDYDI